jgi:hypothetical protein
MSIRSGDTCDGCGRAFADSEGTIGQCLNCGARLCDDCIAKLDAKDPLCPRCGQPTMPHRPPPMP